jgi:flavin reductase (DIM6/NTAB) family NADH-FMN oxidoreductase RutF
MHTRDLEAIDSALRLVNRELWVVTAQAEDRRGGLLATWVSSASIDRAHPVMLAGIAPNHYTAELIDASGALGLHLISKKQLPTAFNFALGSGRERDKLAGLETFTAATGAPLLADCVAWFDCRVFARLATGDRTFYFADVLAGGKQSEESPLHEHELFAAASPEQKAQLIANRDADIALQHPWHVAWREKLPAGVAFPPVAS